MGETKIVRVTRAQKRAAEAIVNRAKITGEYVRPSVRKIAEHKKQVPA